VCSNPEGAHGEGFYPQLSTCWVDATRENVTRQWRKKHEKARPDAAGYLPTDGRTPWVSTEDLTPDDDFL
jgi:hypothetical protein